jgi:type I restriction enzyme R subunit
LKVHVDEDPEYYKKLSEKLQEIIQDNEERWDQLVQLLLDLRDNIETEHQQQAQDLDLTQTQLAFYNILNAELVQAEGKALDEQKTEQVKSVVQSLTEMLDEATQIVDFFDKWDEQKRIKRNIKREIIEHFGESAVKPITERFMELARVHF